MSQTSFISRIDFQVQAGVILMMKIVFRPANFCNIVDISGNKNRSTHKQAYGLDQFIKPKLTLNLRILSR